MRRVVGDDFDAPLVPRAARINLGPANLAATVVDLVATLWANAARSHRRNLRPDVNFRDAIDPLVGKRSPVNSGVDACRRKGLISMPFPGGP